MKKILGFVLAILVMCSIGSLAQAQTTASCYIFNINLGVGSTGPAVISLQTFLIENKFSLPSITSGQKAKGTYDEETAAAVVQYQMSKGLPLTGYVGPLTRASINARCSNVVNSSAYPGKVNVVTRLSGWPVSSGGTCVSTLTGPSGSNTAGCVRALTNQPAGTYTLKWENGYPKGADTTKAPTVSPVRFLGDRPAGENPITFYLDFASSTGPVATSSTPMVSIISRLDGRMLSASEIPATCNVSLSTPKGIFSGPCSRTVQSSGAGTYAVRWSGSWPTGADATKRPTVTGAQVLNSSSITFYIDFVSVLAAQPNISAQLVSANTTVSSNPGANDDIGTFQIKYKVTANGGDVYIPAWNAAPVNYIVDKAGTVVASSSSAVIYSTLTNDTTSTVTSNGNYVIENGSTNTFTLTVMVQLRGQYDSVGQYRTSLTGIKWGTADDATPENIYTSLDGFKTSYVVLNLDNVKDQMKRLPSTAAVIDAVKRLLGR